MPMTSTKIHYWLIGFLALAMLAAACGGDDADSSGGDAAPVEADDDLLEEAQAANDDEEIGTNTADAGGEGDQVGGVTDVDEERVVEGGGIIYGIGLR